MLTFKCKFPAVIVALVFVLLGFGDAKCQTAEKDLAQQYAESSVTNYVNASFKKAGTYRPYSFGEIEIVIPRDVAYLEELKANRKTASGMKDHFGERHDSVLRAYDSMIVEQEKIIQERKPRNNYRIDHLFAINSAEGHKIYQVNFSLSANFKVRDVSISMDLLLNDEEYDWFYYYFMRFNLFSEDSDLNGREESEAIYSYFDLRLTSPVEMQKNDLMRSALICIRTVKKTGEYDPNRIVKEVIHDYLKSDQVSYKGYTIGEFSPVKGVYEVSDNKEVLVGYSVFCRFSTLNDKKELVSQCLYFELDAWFVIGGIQFVEAPYEQYFETK